MAKGSPEERSRGGEEGPPCTQRGEGLICRLLGVTNNDTHAGTHAYTLIQPVYTHTHTRGDVSVCGGGLRERGHTYHGHISHFTHDAHQLLERQAEE